MSGTHATAAQETGFQLINAEYIKARLEALRSSTESKAVQTQHYQVLLRNVEAIYPAGGDLATLEARDSYHYLKAKTLGRLFRCAATPAEKLEFKRQFFKEFYKIPTAASKASLQKTVDILTAYAVPAAARAQANPFTGAFPFLNTPPNGENPLAGLLSTLSEMTARLNPETIDMIVAQAIQTQAATPAAREELRRELTQAHSAINQTLPESIRIKLMEKLQEFDDATPAPH